MKILIDKRYLADKLMVSTRTVDRLVKDGMPHYKVGGQYRFDWDEVIRWLENVNRPKPTPDETIELLRGK